MKDYKTIDQYIKSFPKDVQITLQSIRVTINKAIPGAEEAIRYGMPTFRLNDENLVHFAGYKTHIGFYPAPSAIIKFEKELSGYSTSKGCVRFPIKKQPSLVLIGKIAKFRVSENLGKAKVAPGKKDGSLPHISAPAMRAFANAKIKNLKDLSKWTEKDLLTLHGVGPSVIPVLRQVLKNNKLSFRK